MLLGKRSEYPFSSLGLSNIRGGISKDMGSANHNLVTLLCWQEPDESDLNVARIVEFMGGEVEFVKLNAGNMANDEGAGRSRSSGRCAIMQATTLAKAIQQSEAGLDGLGWISSITANCLVFGFEATPEHGQLLRELTDDGLIGVQELSAGKGEFAVDSGVREICRQFTGLSFGTANPGFDGAFKEGEGRGSYSPLVRIEGQPFFVLKKTPSCELFLLACRQVANLDESLPRGTSIVSFFSRLMPFLMFLYRVSGERLWHNEVPRGCFIIDDPLLRRQYGFLDYQKLLELMERKRFSTSIAFIPWNHRRSDESTIQLFKDHPHRYSICVHGCDHTSGEFGATDAQYLLGQAQKGIQRMRRHAELAGLGFDAVMVFPQGCFSREAINALKSSGYLAAVNSTPYPVDVENGTFQLKELLEGAVTRFSGFPLFVRRYPTHLVELAFDLFLGKPVLLVEHHGFFRDGYGAMAQIVERLNTMEARLEWNNLATVCSRACLQKRVGNGDIHIKFYTDQFTVQNKNDKTQTFVLFRRQAAGTAVAEVRVDGERAAFEQEDEALRFSLSLRPGQASEIRILRGEQDARMSCSWPDRKWQIGVFFRRILSEFRDNCVDKNRFLSRAASTVRSRLVRK